MSNVLNWFEIPSVDFERAVQFYNQVLGIELARGAFMELPYAFFPSEPHVVTGAVVLNPEMKPSTQGTVIYFNAGTSEQLGAMVERVIPAGGQVLMPTTSISPQGFIALMLDSEGNQIGLHAPEGS